MGDVSCPPCGRISDSGALAVSVGNFGYPHWKCPHCQLWSACSDWIPVTPTMTTAGLVNLVARPPVNGVFTLSPFNAPPKVEEDRFPHTCPRCGEKAYIGLNGVEHLISALDDTCK
jgi:hypothetical protein